jgi:phthiodiolone/phenolphthiodiolone dimycocerosates ketoreductase
VFAKSRVSDRGGAGSGGISGVLAVTVKQSIAEDDTSLAPSEGMGRPAMVKLTASNSRKTDTFSVGVIENIINSRYGPDPLVRAGHLAAVAAGVDSFWVPDHINSLFPRSICTAKYMGAAKLAPSPDAYLEPWTMLGYIAAHNRLGRLRLGVSVTDTARRNPAVTAQAAVTLHLLTRGRAILGIGTGEREGNEPYGVDWTKPVARFEEALATILALWCSKGEPVNRDSPYFPLHKAVFDLPPYKGRWPQIWVAAHGPRMLRITGRYADAWFPAFIFRSKDYARGLDAVLSAASDAGRDPSAVTPAVLLAVVTGRSEDDVDEALESEGAKMYGLTASAEVWARHGVEHPLGADFTGAQDIQPQTLDEQTVLEYTAKVPRSLLNEMYLTGTPDQVIEQVAQWRDQGLRYVIVANSSGLQRSLRKGVASSVPFVRIMRGLKKL